MIFKEQIPTQSFPKWLWFTKENRMLLLVSALIIIIQFIWFKILYPLPNFFPDSYEYITSAIQNSTVFTRPTGYVKFLQLFGLVTHSHQLLILFQYIFLHASLFYLLFTIGYLLHPGRWLFRILTLGLISNPLIFHFSNLVGSDPLFTALSLIWLAQLFWIIYDPNPSILITHSVLLFLTFSIRYNALYYPVISVGLILFCKTHWGSKLISLTFIGILLVGYIVFTKSQFKSITGISQLAPFSGWQLAANALTAYTHAIKLDEPGTVPNKFRNLHSLVNKYMNSNHKTRHNSNIQSVIYYLWMNNSPLIQYMRDEWKKDPTINRITQWSRMAPLYNEYGRYLIRKHPYLYFRYYLIPNLKEYFRPFTEYIGMYNVAGKKILTSAVYWFNLKPHERESDINATDINTIKFNSILNTIINIMFIIGLIHYYAWGYYKKNSHTCNRVLNFILLIWLFNFTFSVIASPISLRFQVFQFLTTCMFSIIILQINIRSFRHVSIFRKKIQTKGCQQ